jgi:hypothetical protein
MLLIPITGRLRAKIDESCLVGVQEAGFVQIAFLCGNPEVPENVQLVSVIFMKKFGGKRETLLGRGAMIKSLLKDNGLVPGDTADGEIAYAGTLGRKGELLEHGEQPRDHFLFLEAGKPYAEIKTVSHKKLL